MSEEEVERPLDNRRRHGAGHLRHAQALPVKRHLDAANLRETKDPTERGKVLHTRVVQKEKRDANTHTDTHTHESDQPTAAKPCRTSKQAIDTARYGV